MTDDSPTLTPLSPFPAVRLSFRGLLILTVLFPTLVAVANYLVVGSLGSGTRPLADLIWAYSFFVLEVGLVGLVAGHFVPHAFWRWGLFAWIMILLDLQTVSLAMLNSHPGTPDTILPSASLFAGQIGLVIVWGILGSGQRRIRIPAMICLELVLIGVWRFAISGPTGELWLQILVVNAAALLVICSVMRWRGFRLMIWTQESDLAAGEGNSRFQFSVRDVLVWTTVLAILLGVMRAADMLTWEAARQAVAPSSRWIGTVALLTAITIIVALWAALGQGFWLLRWGLLFVFLLLVGGGLGFWADYHARFFSLPLGPAWNEYLGQLRAWYQIGWWWMSWFLLSGGMLAATLLIFRAVGYRLVRTGRAPHRVATNAR